MSFSTAALWFVCVRSKTANGWHVPTHSQSSVMLLPKSPWLSFSHSAQMAHRRARRAKRRCGSIPSQDLLTENIHDKTWREKGSFCFSLIWYGEDDWETPDVWRQSSSAHVWIYILAFPSHPNLLKSKFLASLFHYQDWAACYPHVNFFYCLIMCR